MNDRQPEVVAFRIIRTREKPSYTKQPISEFHVFETYVSRFGLLDIHLIIFYFNTQHYHYPYGIHPIILKRMNDTFNVVFYQYYTPINTLVGITIDQQVCDYRALVFFLEKQNSMLLSYINPPFIT